jgi:hypothetical protein
MSNLVEQRLAPLRQPFTIAEDGTSQTRLTNHGRVGFYVERLFGIDPNNDRSPDLGEWELKTVQAGKKITIGTMPDAEVQAICKATAHDFFSSEPYNKMKNTLFVVYEKLQSYPEPEYIMRGWGAFDLSSCGEQTKKILQEDYRYICNVIKAKATNQTDLTSYLRNYGSVSGSYLTLGYKGQGYYGYNYPAWSFTAKFVGKLNHA